MYCWVQVSPQDMQVQAQAHGVPMRWACANDACASMAACMPDMDAARIAYHAGMPSVAPAIHGQQVGSATCWLSCMPARSCVHLL